MFKRRSLSIDITHDFPHSPQSKKPNQISEHELINIMTLGENNATEIVSHLAHSNIVSDPRSCDEASLLKTITWISLNLTPDHEEEVLKDLLFILNKILFMPVIKQSLINFKFHRLLLNLFITCPRLRFPILNILWNVRLELCAELKKIWPDIQSLESEFLNDAKVNKLFNDINNYIFIVENVHYVSAEDIKNNECIIGHGEFGFIYKININNHDYALKTPKEKNNSQIDFINEVKIHAMLNHENIIALQGICLDHNNLSCIMEFASLGSLHNILYIEKIRLPLSSVMHIAFCVARALAHIHGLNFMHGDIKPQNILLTSENCAKICDFGCAQDLSNQTTDQRGTQCYFPPETILSENVCSTARDVYALGLVCDEMLGEKPANKFDIFEFAFNSNAENISDNIKIQKTPLESLISECCARLFSNRPPANEIAERLSFMIKSN